MRAGFWTQKKTFDRLLATLAKIAEGTLRTGIVHAEVRCPMNPDFGPPYKISGVCRQK
jgi:hypothetical protein